MERHRYVSYLRVSTGAQGRSGLGLEAQRRVDAEFVQATRSVTVGEFVEVESGRRADRPRLESALSVCRVHKAILLVAKIDRLSRDAHFLLGLKESGVEFVCCDMPSANRLTVGIMAMVAEEEARMISTRTKEALHAAKARGVRLGMPNLTATARSRGALVSSQVRRDRANRRALDLSRELERLARLGVVNPSQIALSFNRERIPATRGGRWSCVQVQRLICRLSAIQPSKHPAICK